MARKDFFAWMLQLQEQQRDKIINSGTYSTTLTVNEPRALAELVGERCKGIKCIVNNKPSSNFLLDIRVQVCIINKDKLWPNVPDVSIQDITSILNSFDSLTHSKCSGLKKTFLLMDGWICQ